MSLRSLPIAFSLLLALTGISQAGPFVAPTSGPVPFRRDRLPLDVDTMTSLSRQLVLVAKSVDSESALGRRAIAQTLALAIALDPANRDARDLVTNYREERVPDAGDREEAERAKARIWQILGWLQSSDAGQDGMALGACLLDTMVYADPRHPNAQSRAGQQDSGEWKGWVAELASYEEKKAQPDPVASVNPTPGTNHDPVAPVPADGGSAIVRGEASISTPLWIYSQETERLSLVSVKISMKAWQENEENHGFRISLENTKDAEHLNGVGMNVINSLKTANDRFPQGGRMALTVGKNFDYLVSRNRDAISAAAAVLADSAVSGREPIGTVMGVVEPDGNLKLPFRAWDRLRALSSGPGGRLILPRAAEPMLSSILAMEDPAFFMKYEVILADNVAEMVDFASKTHKGPLADAMARFAEIRDKIGSTPVSQYVTNRFVRQRLSEISQSCPDHVSARMLFIQSGGERPTRLPRPILASEMRQALEPINQMPSDLKDEVDAAYFESMYEKCRTLLDPLERYVDIRDRDFFAKAKDMTTSLRTLGRLRKSAKENWDGGNGNFNTLRQSFETFRGSYQRLRDELTKEAGDDELPKPKRPDAPAFGN